MSQKFSDAMSKLGVEGGSRNSIAMGRPPPSPGPKRNSGLDPSIINSMFPDAAAAIAKQKEQFTQQTGLAPPSNRNSTVGERASLIAPTISAPPEEAKKDTLPQPPASPWGPRSSDAQRPKSSPGQQQQQPMGQFTAPQNSTALRSPRPTQLSGDTNVQSTTLTAPDNANLANLLSPYQGSGSWASMVNTPMVASFNAQQTASQADILGQTAMKLQALSTVNNRIQFDDVKKFRRSRSTEGNRNGTTSPGIPPANFIMTNELGQTLSPQQAAALQAQQLAALNARRSRPNSPGVMVTGAGPGGFGTMNFAVPQNSAFLSAYDNATAGLAGLNLNQFSIGMPTGPEGYVSDHDPHQRGRSPRGRRGSSKPPEDPTDPNLLQDIPAWLRSLRLHKYTDNLKDLKWQELVELDDEGLEKRGVNALGARRKMLKVHITVTIAIDGSVLTCPI